MITVEAYRVSIGSFLDRTTRGSCENLLGCYSSNHFSYENDYGCFDANQSISQFRFLRLFMFFFIILIMYANLNMSFLKLMRILNDGDVESNPGPTYKILKVVQGSFHQADIKFGETAGRQCACNILFSIAWSTIRRVGFSNTADIDFILTEGDLIYKQLKAVSFLSVDDLPQSIDIENKKIAIEKLRFYQGTIVPFVEKFLSHSFNDEGNNDDGFLLFIDGFTLSVIWNKAYFFLFDSHSRNINGQISATGSSVLLRFRSLIAIEKYIREIYFTLKNLQKLCFEIQYIKINVTTTCAVNIYTTHRKRIYVNGPECEIDKKRMRKHQNDIIGTPQHEIRKQHMREYNAKYFSARKEQRERNKCKEQSSNKARENVNKIEKFKNEIKKGPYFICIVCNRCLIEDQLNILLKKNTQLLKKTFFLMLMLTVLMIVNTYALLVISILRKRKSLVRQFVTN